MKTKIYFKKSRFYIEVFLWKSREELHKKAGGKKDYGAIYKPKAYIIFPRLKINSKLGEIHFYKGRTGVGLLSHEVLHCIFDWWEKSHKGIELENHDDQEKACYYQGELVRKIANWLIKIKEW